MKANIHFYLLIINMALTIVALILWTLFMQQMVDINWPIAANISQVIFILITIYESKK